MGKPPQNESKRLQRIALMGVALSTCLAISTSAYKAFDETSLSITLHQMGLVVMLLTYVIFIIVVIASRGREVIALQVHDDSGTLSISPTTTANFVVVDQDDADEPSGRDGVVDISRSRRESIRVVVARNLNISGSFLELLHLFPNVTLLDVQNSRVSDDFWNDLVHLDQVRYVLAANAVDASKIKDISLSLPEIKFWIEPRTLAPSSLTPSLSSE